MLTATPESAVNKDFWNEKDVGAVLSLIPLLRLW